MSAKARAQIHQTPAVRDGLVRSSVVMIMVAIASHSQGVSFSPVTRKYRTLWQVDPIPSRARVSSSWSSFRTHHDRTDDNGECSKGVRRMWFDTPHTPQSRHPAPNTRVGPSPSSHGSGIGISRRMSRWTRQLSHPFDGFEWHYSCRPCDEPLTTMKMTLGSSRTDSLCNIADTSEPVRANLFRARAFESRYKRRKNPLRTLDSDEWVNWAWTCSDSRDSRQWWSWASNTAGSPGWPPNPPRTFWGRPWSDWPFRWFERLRPTFDELRYVCLYQSVCVCSISSVTSMLGHDFIESTYLARFGCRATYGRPRCEPRIWTRVCRCRTNAVWNGKSRHILSTRERRRTKRMRPRRWMSLLQRLPLSAPRSRDDHPRNICNRVGVFKLRDRGSSNRGVIIKRTHLRHK